MQHAVEMKGITKRFSGIVANREVDFELRPGEIHALLGENGAGKTTLMNVLYGLYHPDAGTVLVEGRRASIATPRDAMALGIGMVHQHFMLIPQLTVLENIVLGMGDRVGRVVRPRRLAAEVRELAGRFGFRLDPHDHVWRLAVGVQQKVEILKALYRGAKVLIMDEPTAVLTPQESIELFDNLRRFRDQGHSVILITHKLDEVKHVADRTTVMRLGEVVGTVETAAVSTHQLAEMMVGRQVSLTVDRPLCRPGAACLEVKDLTVLNEKRLPAVKRLSLEVRAGEILGIAGVDGNGQLELGEALVGLRRPVSGRILVAGRDIAGQSPAKVRAHGVGHIADDRHAKGMIGGFTLQENLILGNHRSPQFRRGRFLDFPAIETHSRQLIEEFDIRAPGVDTAMANLSGGNQQKTVLAREFSRDLRVLIALQPTRGLDVGAIEYVHRRLVEARAAGRAVLLVSTDLDEIMALSDRIAVMYGGEIVGLVEPDTPKEKIGLLMAGVRGEAASA